MVTAAASSPASSATAVIAPFTPDALMNGAATLIGALLGAMVAFGLQLIFQWRQERKAERVAAHRVLFCLFQQANTIALVQRENIAARVDSPARFIEIPAVQEFDLGKNLFDFSSFGFLLRSKDGRQIMYDLQMAQECYVETLRTLNERSRIHRQELQPLLAAANIGFGREVTLGEVQAATGPMVFASMKTMTDQLLALISSTLDKQVAVKRAFRAYAVQHFSTDDFTDFDIPQAYRMAEKASKVATEPAK